MAAEFQIERSPLLKGVAHGFFGSAGGAHQFGYGGPGAREEVRNRRAAAANAIAPGARIVAPHQTHSSCVICVDEAWEDIAQGRREGDAVVTKRKGLALGVVTADCGPVLLADVEAGVIGAAHAGWRGAQGGVLENTIAAMERLGASRARLVAAIGPTIAQPSYEVDAPFKQRFHAKDEGHFQPTKERDGAPRWLFDLPGYISAQIALSEVHKIHDLGRDTFPHPMRYHSYRRALSHGEARYGRQIALIAL
ncbi:MAG: peptidoglycan editing factor PgeF [Pseudomonadota bacterium]